MLSIFVFCAVLATGKFVSLFYYNLEPQNRPQKLSRDQWNDLNVCVVAVKG